MNAPQWLQSTRNKVLAALVVLGAGVLAFVVWGYPLLFERYTGVVNRPLTYETSQSLTDAEFEALAERLTREARRQRAESLMAEEENPFARRLRVNMLMNTRSLVAREAYPHIDYFRKAGIRQYDGPETCLTCHQNFKRHTPEGVRSVDTMRDVVESVHFKFQSTAPGFTTYGYDGREVNAAGSRPIPVGKIDRACGIPGSFSWTGWAALVKTRPGQPPPIADAPHTPVAPAPLPDPTAPVAESVPAAGGHHGDGTAATVSHTVQHTANGGGEMRSEGCGQCHIGGNYHPATELMMPGGRIPDDARQGIDCLICHSRTYDINHRTVIEDEGGMRWGQDRSLRAALTVGNPTRDNCLFCHQHNLGGDAFAENVAAHNLGYRNRRLLHEGSKRATPFSPGTDVHAAAGLQCTDCHVPEGHKIPRGTRGTDLVANDLPGKPVACENCHTGAPHVKGEDRALLNGHVDRVACEACHIRELDETSVVLRDWVHPTWNEEEGIYTPTDIYRTGQPGKGVLYLWFNGNGTFLANALGDNPLGGNGYDPLTNQMARIDDPDVIAAIRVQVERLRERYPEIDVDAYLEAALNPLSQMRPELLEKRRRMIDENIRPLMRAGKSKISPFKIFNALMYEDMSNEGPFGAMILPFDYPTYYETGDPLQSMVVAVQSPIVRRMYQTPFKAYMMDEFMRYFGVEKWSNQYPLENGRPRNVEARWMRQMGTLMVNHAITADGLGCKNCHSGKGRIDFAALGYPPERVADLQSLPELE